jgi:putative SOS response-associated peptidase YedK
MCGRFTLVEPTAVAERFSVTAYDPSVVRPRYNIAPAQDILAVVPNEGRRIEWFRWGLIPHWAKEANAGYRMINARAETIAEKPAFRRSLQTKRCLIPADGFYEWQATGQGKVPMYVRLRAGGLFAFAGVYDFWRSGEGQPVVSCSIITTGPNDLMAPIHNRMPVILAREVEEAWLDPDIVEPEHLLPLLRPYPAEAMEAYPVSRLVNAPKNDSPLCIRRAG